MTPVSKSQKPSIQAPKVKARVEITAVSDLPAADLADLCAAAKDAIERGGGFGWLRPPPRPTLEAYWRGLMMVPGRTLYIARLDGQIAGALQMHEAPRNMESQSKIAKIQSGFTASWARGHGIGRGLVVHALDQAQEQGFKILKLDVRETQETAIKLYRDLGFIQWGHMPCYAYIDEAWVGGLYFYKDL